MCDIIKRELDPPREESLYRNTQLEPWLAAMACHLEFTLNHAGKDHQTRKRLQIG